MPTSDGITTEDWDVVHELAVAIVNAPEGAEEALCRSRLFDYLDVLEERYGPLPSILATRADYIVRDVPGRLDLFGRAYALAKARGDVRNQLYIASSLAALYVEELADVTAAETWLARAQEHLRLIGSEVDRREYERVEAALERLQSRRHSPGK